MFKDMLLEALHKAPPKTVDDLAIFFERSRARLEQSLDKGQVTGEERDRYLAQFQAGLNEAQVAFLNTALETQAARKANLGLDLGSDGPIALLKSLVRQPVIWLVLAAVLMIGLLVGVLMGLASS